MERRFFMNDFEQSLKEHVDEFQMTPSKRVWHGIYNDLHPGKRWPSVAMSFLLIFTLVFIGHLNTNNSHQAAYLSAKNSESKKIVDKKTPAIVSDNQNMIIRSTNARGEADFTYANGQANNEESSTKITLLKPEAGDAPLDNLLSKNNPTSSLLEKSTLSNPTKISTITQEINTGDVFGKKQSQLKNSAELSVMNENTTEAEVLYDNNLQTDNKAIIGKNDKLDNIKFGENKKPNSIINITADAQPKVKPAAQVHKKKNDKITWVYFGAPVVSGVSFHGNSLKQDPSAALSPTVAVNQKENKVIHNSALGFEAGVQMNYKIAKKLQFTTATHFTYSGYNIISNEVHPTFATLILKDKDGRTYSRSFITHYGDGTGNTIVSLRNYNWQASMPLGLQYEFFGNNKFQLNLSSNVEPSLVLKSDAYILSSDGRNYINEPSLLRKWNVSSNFGAFVTFSSPKYRWYIGPNVRYQWLSTYQRDYPVKEHLIDYGIRIGISK